MHETLDDANGAQPSKAPFFQLTMFFAQSDSMHTKKNMAGFLLMLRRILCANWWADEVAFELTFGSLMLPTKVALFKLSKKVQL